VDWYYGVEGRQLGPVDEATLRRLLAEGVIKPDTLVWKSGMAGWARFDATFVAAPLPGAAAAGVVGVSQCSHCGGTFPSDQVIALEGAPVCARCKPILLQKIKEGVNIVASVVDSAAERPGLPWENRQTIGFWTSVWETFKLVMFEPTRAFTMMRRDGGMEDALKFALLTYCIASAVSLVFQIPIQLAMMKVGSAGSSGMPAVFGIAPALVGGVVGLILTPVILGVVVFVQAAAYHGMLHLLGAGKRGFDTTVRVVAFSVGAASVLMLVPVCGAVVAWFWGIVVKIIGLARTHETTGGKASAAVLVPLLICCGTCIGFYAVLAGAIFAAMKPS
jgi:hypothetical protein